MGKGRNCAIGSFYFYISLKAIRRRIAFFFGRNHERQADVVSISLETISTRELSGSCGGRLEAAGAESQKCMLETGPTVSPDISVMSSRGIG